MTLGLSLSQSILVRALATVPAIWATVTVHYLASESVHIGVFLAMLGLVFAHMLRYSGSSAPLWEYLRSEAKGYFVMGFAEKEYQLYIFRLFGAVVNTLIIVSVRPRHDPARTLISTLSRAMFCAITPINLMASIQLWFKVDLSRNYGVKVAMFLMMNLLLICDRYTFGFLWIFPCPGFNLSMIMGYACANFSKIIETSIKRDDHDARRQLAILSVASFQVLSYACVPAFFFAADARVGEFAAKMVLPSGRDARFPKEICESVLRRELSDETFRGILNWYTGWNFGTYESKMLYEYLSKASKWPTHGECDFTDPLVWDIMNSWASLLGSTRLTFFTEYIKPFTSQTKEIATVSTALVSAISMAKLKLSENVRKRKAKSIGLVKHGSQVSEISETDDMKKSS